MSKSSRFVNAVILFSAFSIAVPAVDASVAQGRGRGNAGKPEKADKADKAHKADKKDAQVIVVDRDGHLRVIREYAHGGSLPPGLAKRESLPPGLRKQLHEGGALPPGLQKRLVPVPSPLLVRLPPVPTYYRRYFAGDDLIVVNTRTNRIATIIIDVWR
jgi:hypothetical protein